MLSETVYPDLSGKSRFTGKHIRLFLFIFTLLFIASCSNEKQSTPTEPVTEDQLTKLLKNVPDDVRSEILKETPEEVRAQLSDEITRSISKELNSRGFFVALLKNVSPAPTLSGRCFPLLTVDPITGSGIGTTINRFTILQSHCFNPATLEITEGEAAFTSVSNGDQLWETYFGNLILTMNQNILLISGRTTFTGGTGMFEDATGNGYAVGVLNLRTGKSTLLNISILHID